MDTRDRSLLEDEEDSEDEEESEDGDLTSDTDGDEGAGTNSVGFGADARGCLPRIRRRGAGSAMSLMYR